MNEFQPGVRIAIDWGKTRIGVAACDSEGLLARPVETIINSPAAVGRIAKLVRELDAVEVILGMPIDLAGRQGIAADAMMKVADRIGCRIKVPLRLLDERLTTATAHRQLAAAGLSGVDRRAVIDQAAAVAILEQALDIERRTGAPAGVGWTRSRTVEEG